MKTLTMLTMAGALAASAAPALVVADDASAGTTTPSARQQCRTERDQMGAATFAAAYATNRGHANAFGKCVSHRATKSHRAATTARNGAAADCKAEQIADAAAFAATYAKNKSGKNALGRCVAAKATAASAATIDAQVVTEINAAKSCKAQRSSDPSAFASTYGTKRNAFGKCVSATAKD
jgi:hypothetical protein